MTREPDRTKPPGDPPADGDDDAIPDAALWESALAGDAPAFEELYHRHVDQVHRVLVRRVGPVDAVDLTAEVFAQAWAHRHRIRMSEANGLRPWLLGTALNLARTHQTRVTRAQRLTERLAAQGALADADPVEEVLDALDDARAVSDARAALATLSASEQEILLLCVLEGQAPAEAANALGQRPSTVRSRLSRARGRLTTAFESRRREGDAR